jgi:hypothetical protein
VVAGIVVAVVSFDCDAKVLGDGADGACPRIDVAASEGALRG